MEMNRDPNCQRYGYIVFLRNNVSEESVHLNNIISGVGQSVGYSTAKEIVQTFADDQHIKNDRLYSSNGGKEVIPSCVETYLRILLKMRK